MASKQRKNKKTVTQKREDLEHIRRQLTIQNLSKWDVFRLRREDAIRAYTTARKHQLRSNMLQKQLSVYKTIVRYHENVWRKVNAIRYRMRAFWIVFNCVFGCLRRVVNRAHPRSARTVEQRN